MNLVLVRACSNSCPYCFEAPEREVGKEKTISDENVLRLANWARDSRLRYLSLIGGEPFLHPKLDSIVKTIRRTSPATRLGILTGGIFNKRLLDGLSPLDVPLVFNINEPRDYGNPKHYTKVTRNIELALEKGFKVTLGFNVWRTDFDVNFMPELAHRFDRSNFTWTVANPVRGLPSRVVAPEKFKELSGRVMAMLKRATQLDIETELDCPVPLCFFDDEALAWVRQYHPATASGLGVCKPVLDITPELEVIRCFALSRMPRVKLVDFGSEWELEDWFAENLDARLVDKGTFAACKDCQHFLKGRCQGGCLSGTGTTAELEGFNPVGLEEKMQQALKSGKPDRALELFEAAAFPEKSDLATFQAAVAASRLGDWKSAFRLATRAHYKARDVEFMGQVGEFIKKIPPGTIGTEASSGKKGRHVPYVSCPSEEG